MSTESRLRPLVGGSKRTSAENAVSLTACRTAATADNEWNTPVFGFSPKYRSIAQTTRRLSRTKVDMLWVSTSPTGFQPWFRKS